MSTMFYNPVTTYSGNGSIQRISDLTEGQKVALVIFPEARQLGLTERIQKLLGKRLIYIVEDIQPNPDVSQLAQTYQQFWKQTADCQVIVAVGGGSTIDTAKALMAGTASGRFDELQAWLAEEQTFSPTHCKTLITVPTTAGTGSEVTPWATIWDHARQKKYSLHLPCTWPSIAIIDPELMLSLPVHITISTGLDALSHALEAIWNVNANPVSDTLAIAAAEDILRYLPELHQDPRNLQLRSHMALAALKAGLAFSNTRTALAHSISYEMTLRYGLAHGIACSFCLPYVLGLAWGCDPSRDQILRRLFGPDREYAQAALTSFLHRLNVATQFSDYGVSAPEAEQIIQSAMQGARGKNFIGSDNT
ncbi:iron-containing alcohol dehydrogenase PsrA [Acinetobacter sp. WZC-1]|uniref:iron-containing alcohol dehydrogenase PsrA n=1 Tax=Acinetobacter sp. WZC-1 TaxID=3459034 RepID=UPI00403E0154